MSNKKLLKLNGRKIAFLGLGLENQSLLEYFLKNKVKAEYTICDRRDKKALGEKYQQFKNLAEWRLEEKFNTELYKFDILFRSPGWPLFCPGVKEAIKRGSKINSAMNLFLELCPSKKIIGVSGTKGKGTTASLIYHLLKTAGKRVFLGGNIGVAPFHFINKIKTNDFVVLELSSFQLEDIKHSPKYSVLTNLYREHLAPADPLNPNYHKSFKDYYHAKLKLSYYQKKADCFILRKKDWAIFKKEKNLLGQGQKIFYQASNWPSRLVGEYNKENIGAALALAKILKIKDNVAKKAVDSFIGLEHRLELATEKQGVKYYDNSFSTTPESTILDLKSFKNPIILLAGGADKGANFKTLAKIIKQKVKMTILLEGTGTKRLLAELKKINYPQAKRPLAKSMAEAMSLAKRTAVAGDIVLLSTACASFGMFKNYKERGNLFKQYAKED